jgi:hypothetical protein
MTLNDGSPDPLEAKKFVVHEEFASHYSPVLRAAFTGQFVKAQLLEYHLDATEEAVELLVAWVYTQQVSMHQLETDTYGLGVVGNLIGAWILGDGLILPAFQNACFRRLVDI